MRILITSNSKFLFLGSVIPLLIAFSFYFNGGNRVPVLGQKLFKGGTSQRKPPACYWVSKNMQVRNLWRSVKKMQPRLIIPFPMSIGIIVLPEKSFWKTESQSVEVAREQKR